MFSCSFPDSYASSASRNTRYSLVRSTVPGGASYLWTILSASGTLVTTVGARRLLGPRCRRPAIWHLPLGRITLLCLCPWILQVATQTTAAVTNPGGSTYAPVQIIFTRTNYSSGQFQIYDYSASGQTLVMDYTDSSFFPSHTQYSSANFAIDARANDTATNITWVGVCTPHSRLFAVDGSLHCTTPGLRLT